MNYNNSKHLLEKPIFSIIIPLHNKFNYFHNALASVQAQTFTNYELIIVDDASTDNGISKLREFPELIKKAIVLKRSFPGPGGYAARNLAAKNSHGQYLAFLDADDIWFPDHLKKVYSFLKDGADYAFICTGFEEQLGSEIIDIHIQSDRRLNSKEFLKLYARKDIIHTNSMVVSLKAFLATEGFPESGITRAGDHLLWLRLALLGQPLALCCTKTSRYCRDHSSVVTKSMEQLKIHPITKEVKKILNGTLKPKMHIDNDDCKSLKILSNRKQFHWLLHRKRQGYNIKNELMEIQLDTLQFIGWIKMILALSPSWLLSLILMTRNKLRKGRKINR